jgi:hypothetical protein
MLSRLYPNIYFVQCHIALFRGQPTDPYDHTHDSFSHPHIHSFKFSFNIIMPFYLARGNVSSGIVTNVLYVFRNCIRVTFYNNQYICL